MSPVDDPDLPALDQASTAWRRWGWLASSGWLVFLVFPGQTVLANHPAGPARVLGLLLLAVFALVYAGSFVVQTRLDDELPHPWWVLAVLTGLVLGLSAVIGLDAISVLPFVVAFAVWTLPWPHGVWVALGLVGVATAALAFFHADEQWVLLIPLLLVVGFSALMRTNHAAAERSAELGEWMAVVSERERVARDVHDVLGHSLTAIAVKAELAERLVNVDQARAAEELAQVQLLAREALAEIRSTVAGLRATRIGQELATARTSLAAAGIEADLPEEHDQVDVSSRIVLAWALREAVTNVIRHSGARRCTVELGSRELVVVDDGDLPLGDETGAVTQGNGLRGLRERVAASGGTVTLTPGLGGRGHELRVSL